MRKMRKDAPAVLADSNVGITPQGFARASKTDKGTPGEEEELTDGDEDEEEEEEVGETVGISEWVGATTPSAGAESSHGKSGCGRA